MGRLFAVEYVTSSILTACMSQIRTLLCRLVMDVNKGGATLLASEVEEAFQLRRLEASSRSCAARHTCLVACCLDESNTILLAGAS
jgi:hypothetical protein